ncbi:MAG TPA: hypothetical protein VLE97_11490 [Gaiellaceae bacterium]|nr:hypothetical protein [Gaiellaceae bacterium]
MTKPQAAAASRRSRSPSPLDGPRRDVVYIFEREGERGGAYWLLVLECGHAVSRSRINPKDSVAMISALFRPLSEKLAPKRVQCLFCGSGCEQRDPGVLIAAYGGPARP